MNPICAIEEMLVLFASHDEESEQVAMCVCVASLLVWFTMFSASASVLQLNGPSFRLGHISVLSATH